MIWKWLDENKTIQLFGNELGGWDTVLYLKDLTIYSCERYTTIISKEQRGHSYEIMHPAGWIHYHFGFPGGRAD